MGDIDAGPITQIRDNSYPVRTPSLMEAGAEVVPDELVRDLFEQEWLEDEKTPRPSIIVKDDAVQADLARADSLQIFVENYAEEFTGHRHEHTRVEVSIAVEIRTIHGRQRMWNLAGQCRDIIHRWILALQPFHSLYYDGFQPQYDVGPRRWEGTVRLRLTAEPWHVFDRRVTGEEAPNTDPGAFPDGI